MFDYEFLQEFADYYGSFSLEELADMFGVPKVELVFSFEHLVEENLDRIREEMGFDDEDEEGED